MKRWLTVALFALLGFFYPLLATVVDSARMARDAGVVYRGSTHDGNETLLLLLVLLGGGSFMLLWAWIGTVLAADLRRGVVVLTSSVVLGTAAFLLIGRVIRIDLTGSDTVLGGASLLTWFAASVLAAYLAHRMMRPDAAGSAGA
jgi:hypothetical protein